MGKILANEPHLPAKILLTLTSLSIVALLVTGGFYSVKASLWGRCHRSTVGFQCHAPLSHLWGQYSPFFNVAITKPMLDHDFGPEPLDDKIPRFCTVGVVSILLRHGARGPTATKDVEYRSTLRKIQDHLYDSPNDDIADRYRFLRTYAYNMVPDELNDFGKLQLQYSGNELFSRYYGLSRTPNMSMPFLRASSQQRVWDSAASWRKGFLEAANGVRERAPVTKKVKDPLGDQHVPIIAISEGHASNNTLHHSLCTAHEAGYWSHTAAQAQVEFVNHSSFVSLPDRLNDELHIANHSENRLDVYDAINLLQLCAFDTVNRKHPDIDLSSFCGIFEHDDFLELDHYETLDKWYSYGPGNVLGPTQGVGWVNELLARLTDSPVDDHTSTNSTLDHDPEKFPLPQHGHNMFVDFTHDNDLVAAISALGFYNNTKPISNHTRTSIVRNQGFSSAWVCPFAGRMVVEKLKCPTTPTLEGMIFWKREQQPLMTTDSEEPEQVLDEYVRVIVNGRVMPMECANGRYHNYGMCKLCDFLEGPAAFARSGGRWNQCFT